MPTIPSKSTLATEKRSGFTAVELLLVVIAVPVAILGFIFINAYVPALILQSFGYNIDVWFFFVVNAAALAMGFGYNLLGATRSAGRDTPTPTRLGRAAIGYLLHSILLMLIFGATDNEIGLLHILVAILPMPILWQSIGFAVRRIRASRKPDEPKQSTSDIDNEN